VVLLFGPLDAFTGVEAYPVGMAELCGVANFLERMNLCRLTLCGAGQGLDGGLGLKGGPGWCKGGQGGVKARWCKG